MDIDKISYQDLSILDAGEEDSVLGRLDFTRTNRGRQELRRIFMNPLEGLPRIRAMQEVLRFMHVRLDSWPSGITNGTLIMMEEYLESKVQPSGTITGISGLFRIAWYKTLRRGDYGFMCYSLSHLSDFFRGSLALVESLNEMGTPPNLKALLESLEKPLDIPECRRIRETDFREGVSLAQTLELDHFIREHFKYRLREMMDLYGTLDAWHSMAEAVETYGLSFPEWEEKETPLLDAEGLFHILIPQPVANEIRLDRGVNFLFLTGANMAGKSTYIKAVGIAVFLAHLGMGVPASRMRLSEFGGLLSNIQVGDNILKGESYFYNEVQRVRSTLEKIRDGRHWLVLIDELFKGTNIEDARNCSLAVIRGLSRAGDSLFILSTHLYEIARELTNLTQIRFRYFETLMQQDSFSFNYHLKDGISNDRIGYLILKREGVVDLLRDLDPVEGASGPLLTEPGNDPGPGPEPLAGN